MMDAFMESLSGWWAHNWWGLVVAAPMLLVLFAVVWIQSRRPVKDQ